MRVSIPVIASPLIGGGMRELPQPRVGAASPRAADGTLVQA
jgi:hypothetical protein